MTTTTIDLPARAERVPVPAGTGVPLADRVLMQVGLALLLAGSRRASRPAPERRPRRTVLAGHPTVETARPFS